MKEPLIFQLYVRADRKWVEDILDRAKAAGYRALCVCVDRNYYGRRERDIISRAAVREGFGDPSFQMGLKWGDLVWMKERMGLPLIVKGIATAEDARLSVEHGADVVYVSNHGGRQLDHGQATIEVLPEVVAAVNGRAEILWDGGVLRGTDVVKALCLGARAVGVGKMLGWALAASGEAGLKRMLELMDVEIRTAMGLMGVTSLVAAQSVVGAPGAAGAAGEPDERLSVVRGAAQQEESPMTLPSAECARERSTAVTRRKPEPSHAEGSAVTPFRLEPRLRAILEQEYPRFSRAEYARRHKALGGRDGEGGGRSPADRHREPLRQRAAMGHRLAGHGRGLRHLQARRADVDVGRVGQPLSRSRRRSRTTWTCSGASTAGS